MSSVLTEALWAAAAGRDVHGAVHVARAALAEGTAGDAVLAALADVQHEVGERWYRNEWDVADEHAATAVVDAALAAVDAELAPEVRGEQRRVVVSCPEGEWHAMPARMLAADLRHRGADVSFLGASMPADHLARYASRVGADLVALSVSTVLVLPATAAAVDAVRDLGVPVVLGGPAFGSTPERALGLGADAHAEDAAEVMDIRIDPTRAACATEAGDRRRERDRDVLGMQLDRSEVVADAMVGLGRRFPPLAGFSERQLARTREDLDHIARFAEAAHLANDQTIMDELVEWMDPLLAARGVPPQALTMSLDVLREVASTPQLQGAVTRACERLAGVRGELVRRERASADR